MTLVAVSCMYNHNEQRSSISDWYIKALELAGAIPVILPPSLSPDASAKALHRMDGLLLSGGTDLSPMHYGQQPKPNLGSIDAHRDEQEIAMVKEAHKLGMPIFGICRGMQVLNAALGGTVIQHISPEGPDAIQHRQSAPGWHRHHHVTIQTGTILAAALGEGTIGVNSFHHQAVDQVAPGFVVSAEAPDGTIEGMECMTPWILGVQWHPEMMYHRYPEFLRLFEVFAAACRGERQ